MGDSFTDQRTFILKHFAVTMVPQSYDGTQFANLNVAGKIIWERLYLLYFNGLYQLVNFLTRSSQENERKKSLCEFFPF